MYVTKSVNPSAKNEQTKKVFDHYAQIGLIKGKGQTIHRLVERIQRLAPSKLSILIQGETGSGKELCAQAIHDHSQRSEKPLIAVNCAAIPSNLLGAELFGSESHAYTGASQRQGLIKSASGSTLFLDEVADLSLPAQAALLRVLESGELRPLGSDQAIQVDIRLICASHKDLTQLVQQGKFRADLYHRMSAATLYLPPLRERLEDLEDLIFQFSPQVFARLQACAWSKLEDFAWPGNIRQLKNIIRCLEVENHLPQIYAGSIPLPAHGPWRTIDINEQIQNLMQHDADSKYLFTAQTEKYLVTGTKNDPNTPPRTPISSASKFSPPQLTNPIYSHIKWPKQLNPHQVFTLLPPLSLEAFKESYVQFTLERNQGNISKSAKELEVSRCLIYRVIQAQEKKVA